MAKVFIPGQTNVNSPECGAPTRCMATALLFGPTVENTSVTTAKIKRKGMENFNGQMAGAIEENG